MAEERDAFRVGSTVEAGLASRCPAICVQQIRNGLTRVWRSQNQASQEFFAARSIACCFDYLNEVVETVVDGARKRYADTLFRTVWQQRVGVDSPPCCHLPSPRTEVVYPQDARLTRV
ncbi:hypothetical protein [Krasilnikovia sp. M28-CT-15]|uniref:hypothetical protein n=1 Tax=Krasilnikovia sp. M28-CT-15 TaxID=3373540 RepID=UPI00399D2973